MAGLYTSGRLGNVRSSDLSDVGMLFNPRLFILRPGVHSILQVNRRPKTSKDTIRMDPSCHSLVEYTQGMKKKIPGHSRTLNSLAKDRYKLPNRMYIRSLLRLVRVWAR